MIVVALIYAIGHVSGCQINPAITVALAATGKMPWRAGARLHRRPARRGHPRCRRHHRRARRQGRRRRARRRRRTAPGSGPVRRSSPRPSARSSSPLSCSERSTRPPPAASPAWPSAWPCSRPSSRSHRPPGASINPARTFGPMLVQQIAGGTVQWGQLPVYLLAEFVGAAGGRLPLRRHRHRPGHRARGVGPGHPRKESGREEVHQRPGGRGPRGAGRCRRSPPGAAGRLHQPDRRPGRRPGGRQGRPHLGWRVGPRAAARRLRRRRHARRGLPGRGLHLTRTRPDPGRHQGGRRRRRRRAHRQELHRRRAQLPDGRRARRRRRAYGSRRSSSTTTWRWRTRPGRPAAAAPAPR